VNGEFQRIRKELIVVYCKVLSKHSPGWNVNSHEPIQSSEPMIEPEFFLLQSYFNRILLLPINTNEAVVRQMYFVCFSYGNGKR
jgi:hypothetical protein